MRTIIQWLGLFKGILILICGYFLMFMYQYLPKKLSISSKLSAFFNMPYNVSITIYIVLFILFLGSMLLTIKNINKKSRKLYIAAYLFIGLAITIIYSILLFDYISTEGMWIGRITLISMTNIRVSAYIISTGLNC